MSDVPWHPVPPATPACYSLTEGWFSQSGYHNNVSGAVSAKPKTTIGHKEGKGGTTLQNMSGWSSVMSSAIVPIGLAIVFMFTKEAISMLRHLSGY